MTALSANLVASKERHPDRIALRCDDLQFTFAEFDAAAARVATLLEQAGIEPGDRVGVMLPNTPAFAIVFYGIIYRGAVAVPMNPLLKSREVSYYLSNSGAKALFAAPGLRRRGHRRRRRGGRPVLARRRRRTGRADRRPARARSHRLQRGHDDVAVILHTSGTTGKPKGAMLTHGNLGRNAEVSVRTLVETGPDDVVMGCLPLFHVFGLTCGLNGAVLAGATLTLIPRFDPRKALEVIERDAVTVFEGVPTMYSALLSVADEAAPEATRSLRTCVSGGAALPVQVLTDFEKAFGCAVLEGYGLSESSPAAAFNHPNRARKAGSIGTPIEGVEMRVVDLDGVEVPQGQTGEIQIRGHNVMKGYWNLPDATKATITARRVAGHRRRRTRRRGRLLLHRRPDQGHDHPRRLQRLSRARSRKCSTSIRTVAEAAVIGIPHDSLGEEVGAAVALKKGAASDGRRAARIRQGAGGRLQVSAPGLAGRRSAQGAHRQGPEARHHRSDNRKHTITMARSSKSQGSHDQSRRAGCAARPASHQRHQAIRQPNDAERHLGPLRRQPRSAPRRGGRPGWHADP